MIKNLKQAYLYRVKKKRKKKKKKSRIQMYADKLNKDVPKSEQWFRELFKPHLITKGREKDYYNQPIGKYIADVLNYKYKYIVEIDGSIHNTEIQRFRDKVKDDYYIKRGYTVIRIKAYDNQSYTTALDSILKLRK